MEKGIKVGDYDIPVGHFLCLSPRAVHLDAKLFPNPQTYNPDNFSPSNHFEYLFPE